MMSSHRKVEGEDRRGPSKLSPIELVPIESFIKPSPILSLYRERRWLRAAVAAWRLGTLRKSLPVGIAGRPRAAEPLPLPLAGRGFPIADYLRGVERQP
jgi:hypothetical protein